jgi:hypothetical protein
LQGIGRTEEIIRVALRCEKCGASGIALWEAISADDAPEFRKLLSLSDGFYQRPLIGNTGAPEIICDRCGTGQSV